MSAFGYTSRHAKTTYTNATWVIFQLVTSAAVVATLRNLKLQSAAKSDAQLILQLQAGYYATGHAAGTSVTPAPTNKRNTVAATAAVRTGSVTMGTTFTPVRDYQWNISMPFEQNFDDPGLEWDIPVSTAWALIIAAAPGAVPADITGTLDHEER